jgi:hypothetical protein
VSNSAHSTISPVSAAKNPSLVRSPTAFKPHARYGLVPILSTFHPLIRLVQGDEVKVAADYGVAFCASGGVAITPSLSSTVPPTPTSTDVIIDYSTTRSREASTDVIIDYSTTSSTGASTDVIVDRSTE